MRKVQTRVMALATVAAIAVIAHTAVDARVDVKVEFDKTFDFKPVRTWGWNPAGPGEVKMARTKDDDPEAARQRAEPVIIDAVVNEMKRRKLTEVTTAPPDLYVTYYLLLTTTMTTQEIGQFLPATTAWGLPPFAAATQSLEMMNRGSLVIDLSAKQTVVWRGLAQAKIKMDAEPKQREELLRESVRDLLRRYPPR